MSDINIQLDKEVYLFELDDVLYPRRDYVLQIYYLFASFYEFTEGTVKANDMVQLMKKIYEIHGEHQVFDTIKEIYGVDDKYRENLERLMANGQIPLRLNLFAEKEALLGKLFEAGKQVAILTKGNPVEQLNKLKFIDWGSIAANKNDIRMFFEDELRFKSLDPITFIAEEYAVESESINQTT